MTHRHPVIPLSRIIKPSLPAFKKALSAFRKTSLIIMLLGCSAGFTHASPFAQRADEEMKVSVQTVGNILQKLEQESGYNFFYNNNQIDLKRRVSVNTESGNIFKILEQIFEGTGVNYKVMDNKIILSTEVQSPNQNKKITVTGKVIDAKGEPIIGANVTELNGRNGTVTDINGNFTVRVSAGADKLKVSYIGFKTAEVKIHKGKKLTVYLEEDAQSLNEVMVVAFGKQTRESFTGSAGIIKADDIAKQQVSNPISALKGKVAGVQMIEGSSPTATPTIRIRGLSSINASNDPLIVLDGLPYNGYWSDINPSDVESITVLKDAASNALYGAKGANGVIMITTKTAKKGKATFQFDSKWGANIDAKVDYDYITEPGEYYEAYYRALYNYFKRGKGQSAYDAHVNANNTLGKSGSEGGLGYIVYNVPENQYLIGENGKLNPQATLGNIVNYNGQDYLIRPDDWREEGLRNGLRQEYNLSVNGGTDKFAFYGSVGYMKNEGICYGSDYQRYSARMKADYQARSWLKIGGNMSYSHSDFNYMEGAFGPAHEIAPIYPVYIRDGEGRIMTDANGKLYDYGDGGNAGLNRPVYKKGNAIQSDLLDGSSNNSNGFNVQGYADISFLKDFKLTLNASVYDTENRTMTATNSFYGYNTSQGGAVTAYHYRTLAVNLQQLLNYSKSFGKHNLNLLFGHEYNRYTQTSTGGSKSKMFSYYGNQELDGAIIKGGITGNSSLSNNEGYMFRGQYDYDGRYFLSGSFRRDGSSTFHPDHRWGNFWSLGGAWIVSKENWYNIDWLNMLKVKASYGEQGNDGIGSYYYVDTYYIESSSDELSLTFSNKGNENITWETNGNFNAGIEFEAFKSRFSGSIEYFHRKTSDMLFYFSVPLSLGYSGYYDNVGDMVNQGVEADFNVDVIKTKDLLWSVNLNLTHYKNKVTYLPEDKKTYEQEGKTGYLNGNYFVSEGMPYYTWRLKKYAGVSSQGESMWYYTDDQGQLQKTTTYDEADYYLCGSAMPDVYGGFGTTFSFRGFDLSASFLYSIGGKAYDSGYAGLMTSPYTDATGRNIHKDIYNAWSEENPNSNIPRWQYNDLSSAYSSDRWLTDASSLTFQTLTLGYTVPKSWLKKMKLEKLRLFVTCDNVAYWSKRKGLDPRSSFDGSTSATGYSQTRTISGGFNLSF